MWATQSTNLKDEHRTRKLLENENYQKMLDNKRKKVKLIHATTKNESVFDSVKEASQFLKVAQTQISKAKRNDSKVKDCYIEYL